MKFPSLLLLALLGVESVFAQSGYGTTSVYDPTSNLPRDKHIFVLPPGSHWYDQPWRDSIYLFPQWQEGRIELMNGYIPTHHLLMNYCVYLEMFMVKQDNGEIVPLKYSNEVKYIWLGEHKFVYSRAHGYIEIVQQGKASLAESTFMNGLIQYNGSNVKYGNNGADPRTGVSKTTRYYWMQQKYYIFADSSHHLLRSSPAALPKIFRKQKHMIRQYERQHKIDYNKREDLLEIVSYCNREL